MCARSCRNKSKRLLRHLYYGPLSAVTGGYLIRYKDGIYPNLALSLIWFCFFLSPLSLYYLLFFVQPESAASAAYWTLYAIAVGSFFSGLKIANFRLHRIFDREEAQKRKKQASLDKLRREREARHELSAEQGAGGEGDRRVVSVYTYNRTVC